MLGAQSKLYELIQRTGRAMEILTAYDIVLEVSSQTFPELLGKERSLHKATVTNWQTLGCIIALLGLHAFLSCFLFFFPPNLDLLPAFKN